MQRSTDKPHSGLWKEVAVLAEVPRRTVSGEEPGLGKHKDTTGIKWSEQSLDPDLVPRVVALSEDRPGLGTWTISAGAVLLRCHCQ